MCVVVGVFLYDGFDCLGVLGGLEFYDGVCPELDCSCGDWCDGYDGFVEGAFDLAGYEDGEFLEFGGLGEVGELSVEFSAEGEGFGFVLGFGDSCAVVGIDGVNDY